jgi:hypothetical protein
MERSIVKRLCLFILGASLLVSGQFSVAATPDELADIRQQLQALARRMDLLEQENATLKSQNEALRAQIPPAPAAAPAAPADWTSRVAVRGDVRYRHQQSDDARQNAQRDEHLLRARVAVEARINDDIVAGIGLSTTENGNPRGANARLDGVFSRKNLYLDLGYLDWSFAAGAHAILGKMRMPFARPGQSLFWDSDVNPEGIALTYARGSLFASAYGFWVEENVQFGSTPNSQADTTDTKLYGVQVGNRFDALGGALTLAATYYDLAAAQGRRPFFGGSANGNTVQGPDGVLAYDYEIVQALAEYNAQIANLPVQVWLDAAQNRAAELDTAVAGGIMFGKLGSPGSWEAGIGYQRIEKDALFAQFVDSDFGGGVTDSRGWIFRAGYAPARNWSLTATYYMSEANVDVGVPYDFDRLLLDFNTKF